MRRRPWGGRENRREEYLSGRTATAMATVIKYHNYYKTNSGNIEIRSSRNYCVLLADPLKKEKTKKKKKIPVIETKTRFAGRNVLLPMNALQRKLLQIALIIRVMTRQNWRAMFSIFLRFLCVTSFIIIIFYITKIV